MFAAKQVSKQVAKCRVSALHSFQVAQFSTGAGQSADKQQLFDQLIAEASEIRDYNYKSYFVRRATEDKAQMNEFSAEELQERLEQMKRIRSVQNMYSNEQNVVTTKTNTQ